MERRKSTSTAAYAVTVLPEVSTKEEVEALPPLFPAAVVGMSVGTLPCVELAGVGGTGVGRGVGALLSAAVSTEGAGVEADGAIVSDVGAALGGLRGGTVVSALNGVGTALGTMDGADVSDTDSLLPCVGE